MGITVPEVEAAIDQILGPGQISDLGIENGRVAGYVCHPAFAGMDAAERRSLLWNGLRAHFAERSTLIGVLLLYSPKEYQAMAS